MTARFRTLGAVVALAVWVLSASRPAAPQPAPTVLRIGTLDYSSPGEARLHWWQVFRQRLGELGYREGQSIILESRWAEGKVDRLRGLAEELIRLKVAVIVTAGSPAAQAARGATTTIPIITATGADPVALGLAQSLGRPGGNVTGLTSQTSELTGKRLELLREVVPRVTRMGILWDETNQASALAVREAQAAAASLKLHLRAAGVRGPGDFDAAFSAMTRGRVGALVIVPSAMFFPERMRLADLALKRRLPTVVGSKEYAEAGGLLSYGTDYPDLFRRAADHVDKILKGAKPADLPIEQPMRFELVINLKTAKALGLTFPPSILLRTDGVIQ